MCVTHDKNSPTNYTTHIYHISHACINADGFSLRLLSDLIKFITIFEHFLVGRKCFGICIDGWFGRLGRMPSLRIYFGATARLKIEETRTEEQQWKWKWWKRTFSSKCSTGDFFTCNLIACFCFFSRFVVIFTFNWTQFGQNNKKSSDPLSSRTHQKRSDKKKYNSIEKF